MELKGNELLRGLISLEKLFDCEDAINGKKRLTADERAYEELDVESGRKLKVKKEFY